MSTNYNNATYLNNLNALQFAVLDPSVFSTLTAATISNLTTVTVSRLTNADLNNITTSALQAMNGSQVACISTSAIAAGNNATNAAWIAHLTSSQVGNLTVAQLGNITGADMAALSATDLNALNSTQIAALNSTTFANISAVVAENLTASTVAAMKSQSLTSNFTVTPLVAAGYRSFIWDPIHNSSAANPYDVFYYGNASGTCGNFTDTSDYTTVGYVSNTTTHVTRTNQFSGTDFDTYTNGVGPYNTSSSVMWTPNVVLQTILNIYNSGYPGGSANVGGYSGSQIRDGFGDAYRGNSTLCLGLLYDADKTLSLGATYYKALVSDATQWSSTVTVNGVSTPIIQSISVSILDAAIQTFGEASLSAVGALTASQIGLMSLAQLNGVSQDSFSQMMSVACNATSTSLTSAQIQGLDNIHLNLLLNYWSGQSTPIVIPDAVAANLTSNQWLAVSDQNVADVSLNFWSNNFSHAQQNTFLSKFGAVLSVGELNAVANYAAAGNNTGLTSADPTYVGLSLIDSSTISLMPTSTISGLNLNAIRALSSAQIWAMSNAQLTALGYNLSNQAVNDELSPLGTLSVLGLSNSQYTALWSQIQGGTQYFNIGSMSSLSGIAVSNLVQIPATSFAECSPAALATLTRAQTLNLTAEQIATLSQYEYNALSVTPLLNQNAAQLAATFANATDMASLDPFTIASLTNAQWDGMTTAQVQSLTTAQLADVTTQTIDTMSMKDLKKFSSAQILGLSAQDRQMLITDGKTNGLAANLSALTASLTNTNTGMSYDSAANNVLRTAIDYRNPYYANAFIQFLQLRYLVAFDPKVSFRYFNQSWAESSSHINTFRTFEDYEQFNNIYTQTKVDLTAARAAIDDYKKQYAIGYAQNKALRNITSLLALMTTLEDAGQALEATNQREATTNWINFIAHTASALQVPWETAVKAYNKSAELYAAAMKAINEARDGFMALPDYVEIEIDYAAMRKQAALDGLGSFLWMPAYQEATAGEPFFSRIASPSSLTKNFNNYKTLQVERFASSTTWNVLQRKQALAFSWEEVAKVGLPCIMTGVAGTAQAVNGVVNNILDIKDHKNPQWYNAISLANNLIQTGLWPYLTYGDIIGNMVARESPNGYAWVYTKAESEAITLATAENTLAIARVFSGGAAGLYILFQAVIILDDALALSRENSYKNQVILGVDVAMTVFNTVLIAAAVMTANPALGLFAAVVSVINGDFVYAFHEWVTGANYKNSASAFELVKNFRNESQAYFRFELIGKYNNGDKTNYQDITNTTYGGVGGLGYTNYSPNSSSNITYRLLSEEWAYYANNKGTQGDNDAFLENGRVAQAAFLNQNISDTDLNNYGIGAQSLHDNNSNIIYWSGTYDPTYFISEVYENTLTQYDATRTSCTTVSSFVTDIQNMLSGANNTNNLSDAVFIDGVVVDASLYMASQNGWQVADNRSLLQILDVNSSGYSLGITDHNGVTINNANMNQTESVAISSEAGFVGNVTVDVSQSSGQIFAQIGVANVNLTYNPSFTTLSVNADLMNQSLNLVSTNDLIDAQVQAIANSTNAAVINLDDWTAFDVMGDGIANNVTGNIAGARYMSDGGIDNVAAYGGNATLVMFDGTGVTNGGGNSFTVALAPSGPNPNAGYYNGGSAPTNAYGYVTNPNSISFLPSPQGLIFNIVDPLSGVNSTVATTTVDANGNPVDSAKFQNFETIAGTEYGDAFGIANTTNLQFLKLGDGTNDVIVSNSTGLNILAQGTDKNFIVIQNNSYVQIATDGQGSAILVDSGSSIYAELSGTGDSLTLNDTIEGSYINPANTSLGTNIKADIVTKAGVHTLNLNNVETSITIDSSTQNNETDIYDQVVRTSVNNLLDIELAADVTNQMVSVDATNGVSFISTDGTNQTVTYNVLGGVNTVANEQYVTVTADMLVYSNVSSDGTNASISLNYMPETIELDQIVNIAKSGALGAYNVTNTNGSVTSEYSLNDIESQLIWIANSGPLTQAGNGFTGNDSQVFLSNLGNQFVQRQHYITGNNNMIFAAANSSQYIYVNGTNDIVYGSGGTSGYSTTELDGNGTSITAYGVNGHISFTNGNQSAILGSAQMSVSMGANLANIMVYDLIGCSTVSMASNVSGNISGASTLIDFTNVINDSLNISGTVFLNNYSSTNSIKLVNTSVVIGSNLKLNMTANASATVVGDNNNITMTSNSNEYVVISGNLSYGLSGSASGNNTVITGDYGSNAVHFDIDGTTGNLNETVNGYRLNITGATINAASGFNGSLHGTGVTLNLVANSGSNVTVSGAIQVNNTTGNSIYLGGTDTNVSFSNMSFGLLSNVNATVNGANNTFNFSGVSNTTLDLNGTGIVVSNLGNTDFITLEANSSANVSGVLLSADKNGNVYISQNGTFHFAGQDIYVNAAPNVTIYGSDDAVYINRGAANTILSLYGQDLQIAGGIQGNTFSGSETVYVGAISGANGSAVINDNAYGRHYTLNGNTTSDMGTVHVATGNETLTLAGSYLSVYFNDQYGNSVNATGDAITDYGGNATIYANSALASSNFTLNNSNANATTLILNANAGDIVTVSGNIIVSGAAGNTIKLASGDTINTSVQANNTNFSVSDGTSNATINGNSNTVTFTTGTTATVALNGTGEVVNNAYNNNAITLLGNSSATVNNYSLSAVNGTITLGSSGLPDRTAFANQNISLTSGVRMNAIGGSNDTITMVGGTNSYFNVVGTNQTVNGDTGNNSFNMVDDGSSVTAYGIGGYFGLCGGNNESATLGSANMHVGFANTNFIGETVVDNGGGGLISGDWVNGGNKLGLTLTNNNSVATTLNLTANASDNITLAGNITLNGATGNTIRLNTANVSLSGESNATFSNGTGSTLNLAGTDNVTISGATIRLANNTNATVNGSNNTVTFTSGTTATVALNGTGEVVNNDYWSSSNATYSAITLLGNSNATVNGKLITATSGTVSLNNTNTYDRMAFANQNISIGSGFTFGSVIGGYNDTIYLTANGNSQFYISGSNQTVQNDTGNTINIGDIGTSATVYGAGGKVNMGFACNGGNNQTLTLGSASMIVDFSNQNLSGDVITDNGGGGTIKGTDVSGGYTLGLTLTNNNSNATTLNLTANASDNITLAGNITLNGATGNTIRLNTATVSLSGESNAIFTNGTGSTLNLAGTDVVTISGATIRLANNTNATVNGSNDTIQVGANENVTVTGNNNITLSGNDTIYVNGANVNINASGSGSTVYLVGDSTANVTGNYTWGATTLVNGTYNVNNQHYIVSNGTVATVNGSNNTVNFTSGTTATVALNGTGEMVNNDYNNNAITLLGNSGATVNNYSLSAVNGTITLATQNSCTTSTNNYLTDGISFANQNISLNSGVRVNTIAGYNDTITMVNNTNSYLNVYGRNQTVVGDGGNNSFNVIGDGSSVTLLSSANGYVGISNSNQTVTLGSANIRVGFFNIPFSGTVYVGDSIIDNGGGASIYANTAYTTTASGANLTVINNASAATMMYLTANANDNVTLSGNMVVNSNASGNNFFINSNSCVSINGQYDYITFCGSSSVVTISDNSTDQYYGAIVTNASSTNLVTLASNSIARINGNWVTNSGGTVNLGNETYYLANQSIQMNNTSSMNSTIYGQSDTINMRANTAELLYLYGTGNTVNWVEANTLRLEGNGAQAVVNGEQSNNNNSYYGFNVYLDGNNQNITINQKDGANEHIYITNANQNTTVNGGGYRFEVEANSNRLGSTNTVQNLTLNLSSAATGSGYIAYLNNFGVGSVIHVTGIPTSSSQLGEAITFYWHDSGTSSLTATMNTNWGNTGTLLNTITVDSSHNLRYSHT